MASRVVSVLLFAGLSVCAYPGVVAESVQGARPELEYLKQVNSAGPVADPQLIFLLMGQYLNAGQLEEGIGFFDRFLAQHGAALGPREQALYLAALGLLRAARANDVPLLRRVGWVRDTIALLEAAKRLSGDETFIVRWISGTVYAQLPGWFGKREAALEDLRWCLDHSDRAPHAGWLREVNYRLAILYHGHLGDEAQATDYLKRSGYRSFGEHQTLTTPFAANAMTGATFSDRRIQEVVPGRIFALSGFEFTEFYFVVSADRRHLIAIDAGTRPDSAQAAYQALASHHPDLPPLTTVFFTHAHWDHIGGSSFFRQLNPHASFYARANYRQELDELLKQPFTNQFFFGQRFSLDLLREFAPDVLVTEVTSVTIGGTAFSLIPVAGGETPDGLFVYMPESRVLFAGDFAMPYFGAPFVEEGSVPGFLRAIDTLLALQPEVVLHGHEPLTRLFTPQALPQVRRQIEWLHGATLDLIRGGATRADIQQRNLVPPFIQETPLAQVAYLAMRENLINRVYDQVIGYWQPGLLGLDHLSEQEKGAALARYFGLSDKQIGAAVDAMVAHGDLELAAMIVNQGLAQYPESAALRAAKTAAFQKLREKYQEFNPFKFFLYSEEIGAELPQLSR